MLTKPLGLGCLTTALKQGKALPEHIEAGHRLMGRLNRRASEAMERAGAHAATDVTGYGLLGHAYEMAEGAGLSARIRWRDVPILPEAAPYLSPDFACGGTKRNLAFGEGRVEYGPAVTDADRLVLADVQTSGGLLIAVPADRSAGLVDSLREGGDAQAAEIGEFLSDGARLLVD